MNVPNHEKKTFKDMTPEERSAIVEAWLAGGAEYFSEVDNKWTEKSEYATLMPFSIYRTRQRQLTIPWEHIKPAFRWAAMDGNESVYFFKQKPELDGAAWIGGGACYSNFLNIDTTLIDWRESLVQRPEGV